MWSSFAVDGYLHTVASVGFLFILNFDARNHELKKKKFNPYNNNNNNNNNFPINSLYTSTSG